MHGVNGQEIPELKEGLSQGLKADLRDGLDWQWLKVISAAYLQDQPPRNYIQCYCSCQPDHTQEASLL